MSAQHWALLAVAAVLAIAVACEQVQNHRRRQRIAELDAMYAYKPTPERP